jgi:hypothetical protein
MPYICIKLYIDGDYISNTYVETKQYSSKQIAFKNMYSDALKIYGEVIGDLKLYLIDNDNLQMDNFMKKKTNAFRAIKLLKSLKDEPKGKAFKLCLGEEETEGCEPSYRIEITEDSANVILNQADNRNSYSAYKWSLIEVN